MHVPLYVCTVSTQSRDPAKASPNKRGCGGYVRCGFPRNGFCYLIPLCDCALKPRPHQAQALKRTKGYRKEYSSLYGDSFYRSEFQAIGNHAVCQSHSSLRGTTVRFPSHSR